MTDTVLDDALADFDIPTDRLQPAAAKSDFPGTFSQRIEANAASSAPAATVPNGASSAPDDNSSAFQPFRSLPERKKKPADAGKPVSFDPLGKGNLRKKTPPGKPAACARPDAAAEASGSKSSIKPQPPKKQQASQSTAPGTSQDAAVDRELAQGMAQLMADLAKADGRMGTDQGQQTASKSPHEREMASTLAALAAAAPSSGDHTGLEQLLGADGESEGSFASLADTIMQQLLSKDVLYQPMKDIGAKYPAWLATHRESLPAGEVQRYEAQYKFIQQICALYEEEPNDFGKLFHLIQEMQACGQPPDEIVQDLAPGLAFGEDGLPQLPSSATDKCTIC